MLKIEQPLTKELPNLLFYQQKSREYRMFNLKEKKVIGELMVTPRQNELFINSLIINENYRRQGFGTKLLDFAKNLSIKMGFKGKMRGIASLTSIDTKNPSHIFYRKYGFTTDNKELLNKIDCAIKEKKQLDYEITPMTYMYYSQN